jgi:hypothetical protein
MKLPKITKNSLTVWGTTTLFFTVGMLLLNLAVETTVKHYQENMFWFGFSLLMIFTFICLATMKLFGQS